MREQEQRSREFWDGVADAPERGTLPGLLCHDALLSEYRDLAEKRVLLARLGERLAHRRSVLEVGCGGGRWTTWLAERVAHVTAVDISPKLVEQARQRVEHHGLTNASFAVGSFETHRFDEAAFDLVYLGSCLHYMSLEAIEEAAAKMDAWATPDCLVLSRDTVSLLGRTFARSERYRSEDPAIYRPASVYAEVLGRHGWRLADSWVSYARPLSWRLKGLIPRRLRPAALRAELRLARLEVWLSERWPFGRGDKQHRFFVYEREPSPEPSEPPAPPAHESEPT
jgi:SAM-dependent methyltransferase